MDSDELWRKLCEQAVGEPNPQKLMELSREINRLLEEREKRGKGEPVLPDSAVA